MIMEAAVIGTDGFRVITDVVTWIVAAVGAEIEAKGAHAAGKAVYPGQAG
jgi:hypothetical protein